MTIRPPKAESDGIPGPGPDPLSPPIEIGVYGRSAKKLLCYWVIQVEGVWHSNHASAMSG